MSGRCRCCGLPGAAGLAMVIVGSGAMGFAVLAATGVVGLEHNPGKALGLVLEEGLACCLLLPWALDLALSHLGWLVWNEEGVRRRTVLGRGSMAWGDVSRVEVSQGHFGWPCWTLLDTAGRAVVLPFDAVGERGTPLFDELERRLGQLRRAAGQVFAGEGAVVDARRSALGLERWLPASALVAAVVASALAISGATPRLVSGPVDPVLARLLAATMAIGALIIAGLFTGPLRARRQVALSSSGMTSLDRRQPVALTWSEIELVNVRQTGARGEPNERILVKAGEREIRLPGTCANYLAARDYIVSQAPLSAVTWEDASRAKPLWRRLLPSGQG